MFKTARGLLYFLTTALIVCAQTDSIVAELRTAAASIGRQIEVFGAGTNGEIDAAFLELVRKGTDALVVGSSVLFNIRRVQVVTLARFTGCRQSTMIGTQSKSADS